METGGFRERLQRTHVDKLLALPKEPSARLKLVTAGIEREIEARIQESEREVEARIHRKRAEMECVTAGIEREIEARIRRIEREIEARIRWPDASRRTARLAGDC